jgi:cyclophilin family peptidyl-prolyl cis-trans isomerase
MPVGKITMGLYKEGLPKTVRNFVLLTLGHDIYSDTPVVSADGTGILTYKSTRFFRIIPGKIAEGGDVISNNGEGSESADTGKPFPDEDENFTNKHDRPYLLTMANKGKDSNASQFMITLGAAPELDGKHIRFGEVLYG